jgi:hypothetical protein
MRASIPADPTDSMPRRALPALSVVAALSTGRTPARPAAWVQSDSRRRAAIILERKITLN